VVYQNAVTWVVEHNPRMPKGDEHQTVDVDTRGST
jgi:hypothetical protein